MPGRKPIFVTLVKGFLDFTRDFFYRILLEPDAHEKRRDREARKNKH